MTEFQDIVILLQHTIISILIPSCSVCLEIFNICFTFVAIVTEGSLEFLLWEQVSIKSCLTCTVLLVVLQYGKRKHYEEDGEGPARDCEECEETSSTSKRKNVVNLQQAAFSQQLHCPKVGTEACISN